MYKTILVPLDGSEVAEAILPHVEELAKLFGSTVILLQGMELPHLIALPKGEIYDALPQLTPAEVNQQLGQTRHYLDGLVARLDIDDISARPLVEYGPVVATILRVARQEEAKIGRAHV